jgi:hypothetical protein
VKLASVRLRRATEVKNQARGQVSLFMVHVPSDRARVQTSAGGNPWVRGQVRFLSAHADLHRQNGLSRASVSKRRDCSRSGHFFGGNASGSHVFSEAGSRRYRRMLGTSVGRHWLAKAFNKTNAAARLNCSFWEHHQWADNG